jgi:GNAT superfamily N-acetyltransferase
VSPTPIIYRQATRDEIHALRVTILRPGQTSLHFPHENVPATLHFGAFLEAPASERNIACVTYLASTWENKPAFQLRGMAVDPAFRNAGVGGKLIDFAESTFAPNGPRILWCNARNRAIPFYTRHGYKVASEEFDVPGIGPHRVLVKQL